MAETSCSLSVSHQHYLYHVLRRVQGDELHLFNGVQGLWRATLEKKAAHVQTCLQAQPEPLRPLSIFFSPIKQQGWLVEKATELGVTHFVPLLCQHTAVRHFAQDRHEKIAQEACEQSHRLALPQFHPIQPLEAYLVDLEKNKNWTFLDPQGKDSLSSILPVDGVFVGPEGGWNFQEKELFRHSGLRGAHLGPRILRAETAALAALACITLSGK